MPTVDYLFSDPVTIPANPLASSGIALGIGGAFVVARLLSSQLYGVSPMDAVTYITVSIVVAIVTLAACYIPARRAMAIDPIIALRYD